MKEKPILSHSVPSASASGPSFLVFVSEKSHGIDIEVLLETVKGEGTDPTHPVSGKLKAS